MKIMKLLGLFIVLSIFSCTAPYQQGPATGPPGGIESALREYLASSPEILVVKDKGGTFWAMSASGVEEIVGNTIHVSPGTLVANGTGEKASDQQIAESLASILTSTGPKGFFLSNDEEGNLVVAGTQATVGANAAIPNVVKLIRVNQ